MSTAAGDWPRKHRITVDEYYRMAEVGLLAPDARVELIQGEVIDIAPIGSRHGAVVDALGRLMHRLGDNVIVGIQRPIKLSIRSEPQPDLVLLKPRADFYSHAHPTASDVLLLVEVSDTTLRYDRDIKLPLYASHGIAEMWLIDLNSHQLSCHRQPIDHAYTVKTTLSSGSITPSLLPEVSIEMTSVLSL